MEIRIVDFEILTRHYTKYQEGINEINTLKKLFMDRIEYENAPKTLYPDGSKMEGFSDAMFWEKYIDRKSMAGLMVCGLAVAFLTFSANKEK
jgi:hypothetical protein